MSSGDIVYGGTYAGGIVLSNPATQNPATIAAAGTVANTGVALYGAPVAAWSVTNLGTIAGGGAAGVGIALVAGGTVANAGLISGEQYGLVIAGGAGTVVNSGTIEATGFTAAGPAPGIALVAGGSVTNISGGVIKDGVFIGNRLGTVTNSGTLSTINLDAGGGVTNDNAGTIDFISVSNGAGTVINSGSIIGTGGGVSLDEGGSVINNAGAMLSGAFVPPVDVRGGAGTIVNAGYINGSVFLNAGGSVTNAAGGTMGSNDGIFISGGAGTVVNSGSISDSLSLYAGGAVTNLGALTVLENNGAASGIYNAAVAFGSSGTLTNLGTIEAGASPSGSGPTGVILKAGGYVGNGASGTPGALISGTYFGVLGYGSSTIVNDGRIVGTGSYGIGVYLGGDNSTLVNAGRIGGAYGVALYLAGSYDDLRVQPGARFAGLAMAGGTYDTLELGSGTGRLAGLGAKFSGFYNIVVDPGAVWTVSGPGPALAVDNDGVLVVKGETLSLGRVISDAGYRGVIRIAADGTAAFAGAVGAREHIAFTSDTGTMQLDRPSHFRGAITGFGSGDTIELVNQTADAVSFANNSLSVTDNGAAVADLHLFGTFTSADFALSSDGHSGTDITLLPPAMLAVKT